MKKMYRYIIYKLYSWGLKRKSDTPVLNVLITLTCIHIFQLFILYCILLKFFPSINFIKEVNKFEVISLYLAVLTFHYFVVYDKFRWNEYIKEFENESKEEGAKGTVKVIILNHAKNYACIILFFILMPILFAK